MPEITMSLIDARKLARAIVAHARDDGYTPVLSYVAIIGQHAYATDRYTVGSYDLTNVLKVESTEDMVIPRAALQWIMTLPKAWLLDTDFYYTVTFEHRPQGKTSGTAHVRVMYNPNPGDPNQVTELHALRTFDALGSDYNFPPVARLFDGFVPLTGGDATDSDSMLARVGIGGEQMSKFATYSKWERTPMRVTLPRPSSNMKYPPLLIEIGPRFKGLLQPNLLLGGFGNDIAATNLAADRDAKAKAEATKTTSESTDDQTQG